MLLILTPLAIEHAALAPQLPGLEVAVGGHGKVQFALSTQLLIQKFKPRLVVCAGAAGSLHADVQPLDVVIGETTIEHDYRLHFVQRPLPAFAADLATLERLRRQSWDFPVHFGRLASGDEDVVDRTRAAQIQAATEALAVAWEGAGAARACRLHGVPFVEIRAVTDSADSSAVQHFTENVRAGMANVAQVILRLV